MTIALDLKELKEENDMNVQKVNEYSEKLKIMKKGSEDNIKEFET